MPKQLTPEIITAAIVGFEQQKLRIDAQVAELRAMLSGSPAEPAASSEPTTRKRRKMSAAGRKAIAEAPRKRWAASKRAAGPLPATQKAPKAKRKLSAAGRANIVAATKKRWALKRAEAKKTMKDAAKKPAKKKTAKASTPAAAQTAG